jgi:hypothetical protein
VPQSGLAIAGCVNIADNPGMRYREGTETELPRSGVDQGMLIGTVSYSLLLGIAMVVVGLAARQRWIAFWGGTLVLASAAFLIATLFNAG